MNSKKNMKDIIAYIAIGVIVVLFFYYGYRDDYKRSPKGFVKTIIGVPIGVVSAIFGFLGIRDWVREWIKKEEK